MSGIVIEIIQPDNHVNVAERSIRKVKDQVRCITQQSPYYRIPLLMVKRMVQVVLWLLNQFPVVDRISDEYSLLSIICKIPPPEYKNFSIDFGAYVEVFEDNKILTNTNQPRGVLAIYLGPAPFRNHSLYVMSLITGKRIHRKQFIELPITDSIISIVKNFGHCQK